MAAPASEPREWEYCPTCHWCGGPGGAGCPECGQPPRCVIGKSKGSRCPRPATVVYTGVGLTDVCHQHHRDLDLAHAEEEWERAEEYLGKFRDLAETLCNWALLEAMDLAAAECEMRLAVVEAERKMVWE